MELLVKTSISYTWRNTYLVMLKGIQAKIQYL